MYHFKPFSMVSDQHSDGFRQQTLISLWISIDKEKANCVASQETLITDYEDVTDDEDVCDTGHFPGMVTWGKIPGYPWYGMASL